VLIHFSSASVFSKEAGGNWVEVVFTSMEAIFSIISVFSGELFLGGISEVVRQGTITEL
jgi:hypothetical protein